MKLIPIEKLTLEETEYFKPTEELQLFNEFLNRTRKKFRVWTGKEMLYEEDIKDLSFGDIEDRGWMILLCANKLDSKGQLVYEGDLLAQDRDETTSSHTLLIFDTEGMGWNHFFTGLHHHRLDMSVVKGNIFENPNLYEEAFSDVRKCFVRNELWANNRWK